MTKTSTFQFTINNLASKIDKDLVSVDNVVNFEENYAEVFDAIESLNADVSDDVIKSILKYAAEKK